MGLTKRWIKRIRTLVRRDVVERELDEELAFHLEMETKKNLQAGMTPEEARRHAAIRFGGVDRYKEKVREARTLGWVPGMSLDFKLGFRVLTKYRGLTTVSLFSMSISVAGAGGFFAFTNNFVNPKLPVEEGDRIVAIQSWNVATGTFENRILHDFVGWETQLESVQDLGVFSFYEPNLITEGGRSEPIRGSKISAAAFRITRTSPLLGRTLVEADEEAGAEAVVVIGFDLWQDFFAGDPQVVGRAIQVGPSPHTIVGVMPEEYGFPFNDNFWVPFRESPLDWGRLSGPGITVFGKLAPGITLNEAQTELSLLGRRTAAEFPETHELLRPQAVPFAKGMVSPPTGVAFGGRLILVLLLLVVSANVGALIFVRNLSREGEITLRAALGASRRRIVFQLFVETLVLASVASVVGLFLASQGIGWFSEVLQKEMFGRSGLPFWWRDGIGLSTLIFVGLLTLLGSAVSGLLPALTLTRFQLGSQVQNRTTGGSYLRFGRKAKLAIVGQITLSVGLLMTVFEAWPDLVESEAEILGLIAEEYLSARLMVSQDSGAGEDPTGAVGRLSNAQQELERLLFEEPEVSGVTFASSLPGTPHRRQAIELETDPAGSVHSRARTAQVDADFFTVMGAPLRAGRTFNAGDLYSDGSALPVAIVNQSFVRTRFQDRNPIGQRLRILGADGDPGPWLEVVGVAGDFGMDLYNPSGLYLPLTPGTLPLRLAARLNTDPANFTARLRSAATSADPELRMVEVRTMAAVLAEARMPNRIMFTGLFVATFVGLALTLSGVYALMSFFVSRRIREIGIRAAIGAKPSRLVVNIFSQALVRLGTGVVFAAIMSLPFTAIVLEGGSVGTCMKVSAVIVVAGLLACLGPTRRVLKVQPVEAIQVEG